MILNIVKTISVVLDCNQGRERANIAAHVNIVFIPPDVILGMKKDPRKEEIQKIVKWLLCQWEWFTP